MLVYSTHHIKLNLGDLFLPFQWFPMEAFVRSLYRFSFPYPFTLNIIIIIAFIPLIENKRSAGGGTIVVEIVVVGNYLFICQTDRSTMGKWMNLYNPREQDLMDGWVEVEGTVSHSTPLLLSSSDFDFDRKVYQSQTLLDPLNKSMSYTNILHPQKEAKCKYSHCVHFTSGFRILIHSII